MNDTFPVVRNIPTLLLLAQTLVKNEISVYSEKVI